MRRRLTVLAIAVGGGVLTVGVVIALAAPGPPRYPNFVAVVPHHFTVQNNQQHEFLRFSNGVANVGDGPFRIRPENVGGITHGIQEVLDENGNIAFSEDVSQFLFHPAHNHWHINAVALFALHKGLDDGTGGVMETAPVGGTALKTTFCLIDWIKLDGNSPNNERAFTDCKPDAPQGISVGWVDQYHHALEGQEVEMTGVAPGVYYFVTTANPDNNFLETNHTDNVAWASFRLSRNSNGNPKIAEISHSACSGPLCGEGLPNR